MRRSRYLGRTFANALGWGAEEKPVEVEMLFLGEEGKGEVRYLAPLFDDGVVVRGEAELGGELFVEDFFFVLFLAQNGFETLHDIVEMDVHDSSFGSISV